MTDSLDRTCINTLRLLAADMVEEAQSGHPGTPMGIAPVAYVLWTRCLRHNPRQPGWADRDRFVLSNGHASSLLYSLLHLSGYDLSLEDLKRFRKLHSRTPGHPEMHACPGIEITTGPLGQGLASAVGMAIAEAHLAAEFNRPGAPQIVSHHTYVLCSDGDMMEGVTSEAASLAGHLGLGRLVCLYDSNQVTIDGPAGLAVSEDTPARFRAYGWHVQEVADGNDLPSVEAALQAARAEERRPSLVVVHTVIGYGSPSRAGKAAAHYGALGEPELRATRDALDWGNYEHFAIPPEVQDCFFQAVERGRRWMDEWEQRFQAYAALYPHAAAEFRRRMAGELPEGWQEALQNLPPAPAAGEPTRMASGLVVNALAPVLPELLGGSADLAFNTQVTLKNSPDFSASCPEGRNFHFGIREHAMAAACNGMALHGGLRPFCATFLVFSDYLRPSLRLAAITGAPTIFVFTNDSIGLGEDGPTHQPVEHLAALRAMPNLLLLRPCDRDEALEAWKVALENRTGPTCLVFTRQPVPALPRSQLAPAELLRRGAYILAEASHAAPQVLLIASGSEVHIALEARQILESRAIPTRVVSMPSWELFARQDAAYRAGVLPPGVRARVAVEAGASLGWERWVGLDGRIIALDRFGASAAPAELYAEFGITAGAVARAAEELVTAQTGD